MRIRIKAEIIRINLDNLIGQGQIFMPTEYLDLINSDLFHVIKIPMDKPIFTTYFTARNTLS